MQTSTDNLAKCLNTLKGMLKHIPPDEYSQIPAPNDDPVDILNYLKHKLLDPLYTENIGLSFPNYILFLVTSIICKDNNFEKNVEDYQFMCIALSKLMLISKDVARYGTQYFHDKPAPFETEHNIASYAKKTKTNLEPISHIEIVKCCYRLLVSDPTFFKNLWNWSNFISANLNQGCDLQKLYFNHAISILTHMTPKQLKELNAPIGPETVLQFYKESSYKLRLKSSPIEIDTGESNSIIDLPFDNDVIINLEGVLLPVFNTDNKKFYEKTDGNYESIVKVGSTKFNLRRIGLGIQSGKAVCLSGPVGCGKTMLVEYLARKTGRVSPKQMEIDCFRNKKNHEQSKKSTKKTNRTSMSTGGKRTSNVLDEITNLEENRRDFDKKDGFLRIQLGDQTDSKMLLGQYHCTDIPGEFVWSPGVLTQAVMNGYWLLLEDLDSATQDTFTILNNLLENNYLTVPGFRDCVKIEPGFQLFVTIRTNAGYSTSKKSLLFLLDKYLYTVKIHPLTRNDLCTIISTNYPALKTVANRIVDVYLTFSSGDHKATESLMSQQFIDNSTGAEEYQALPFEDVSFGNLPNSGRLVSTRDLIKLCTRSNPSFSVTSTECAYFVFQNAVDLFCSYLPQGKERTHLITGIGAKLGIIQSRCEFYSNESKPDVQTTNEMIQIGRAKLPSKDLCFIQTQQEDSNDFLRPIKKQKLSNNRGKAVMPPRKEKSKTFSFTRIASCLLERIAVCVEQDEPVLLVGETGVGKTLSIQFLAERTNHKLVVVNMNNQSDVSDLIGGFKPVDLNYVLSPLRYEFENLFRKTYDTCKNETFLNKFTICYNQGQHTVLVKLMLTVVDSVFSRVEKNQFKHAEDLPKWKELKAKLVKLNYQLGKSINISFAFIPGSLVNCIKNGDWILLDEINLASAETLECLSTILEPDGSVVLLEKGDFTPVKRHPDFRIFACMNPSTDIGKKDLPVGIRNRFTEFFADELTTDNDLSLLVSDYLQNTGIEKRRVTNIVKLYKQLKKLSELELNDGLGNRPVYSLRTLCRSLRICAKNLCGSIERNLYESICLSFLTQLDPQSHNIVLELIKQTLLSNAKAILSQDIPKPKGDYINFEGYWIHKGTNDISECSNYIITKGVAENLKDLSRIISIGGLPVLLQGPTSAGKTSLIEYIAKKSGNHCLRINNHEHTDLQEYIGTYTSDASGKLTFKEGVLVQAMRSGFWIILDELNLAPTDILEALNRVLDDNRELFIPETQKLVRAHPNFMLFATQNPPGLYGGRKTLSRAFKNRFVELHFSEIPKNELEIILEKRCLLPVSYAKKMVECMWELQRNRKSTATTQVFTLRDLFRWGNRYTFADKTLLNESKYDWNQHLVEEGYLLLSAKVRTEVEIDIIKAALYKHFKKHINLDHLFGPQASSLVTKKIIEEINTDTGRNDIVWTRNITRMAVLTAKALQFDEPVLLVGPTGCGKTTICQILSSVRGIPLKILNCHMHTEAADFLGGLRPFRDTSNSNETDKLFEWADGPLITSMNEGSYFMIDEISLAEDSVLERLNSILEPERTILLAEKGGMNTETINPNEFVVKASKGFQFLATMNPGGDFGKKELSPALRNRFTEIWCTPTDSKEDLVNISHRCLSAKGNNTLPNLPQIAELLVKIVFHIRDNVNKFKFSLRDVLAWSEYIGVTKNLKIFDAIMYGLTTVFLDSFEMLPYESSEKITQLKSNIINFAVAECKALSLINGSEFFQINRKPVLTVTNTDSHFGVEPFCMPKNANQINRDVSFFDVPTTKMNLFRILSALTLNKPVLLEGPPGVGKTSTVENLAHALGYQIVRINLCEHTDLGDLFGTDLPVENNLDSSKPKTTIGSFSWRDGPLLAALKSETTWILLDELNLAPQSVLEGLNAILDHRGEVFIPELNKTFTLKQKTRIFACQNPLRQGGGRKGLPQSFLNRFTKVYIKKLKSEDMLYIVNQKYQPHFSQFEDYFKGLLLRVDFTTPISSFFEIFPNRNNLIPCIEPNSVPFNFDLNARLVAFTDKLNLGMDEMKFSYKGGPFEINLRDILRWCDLLTGRDTGYIRRNKKMLRTSDPVGLLISEVERFLLVLYERMKLVYCQRMRSEDDKKFIRKTFSETFNCNADELNTISEDVSLYWTDTNIYLNDIVLDRQPSASSSLLKLNNGGSLLLSGQREYLKNLIECVQMEKPILLCGPEDSGKTKLIDTLCSLSNEIYNTDTIDDSVTGSFQQIDLNRHLEEISQDIEVHYIKEIQNQIFKNQGKHINTHHLEELVNSWYIYTTANARKTDIYTPREFGDEVLHIRKRIKLLSNVTEKLLKLNLIARNSIQELEAQKVKLRALIKLIQSYGSLNTGGSFEWVDSKIVKSLKTGQYIGLEHANLCSSAVLDRLNSVFEPNGKLLISEKGVTNNSEADEVEKHKNFRAFLIINPKNGELSRAMRNRCMEIALNKDHYTKDDLRTIIYQNGVRDIGCINAVLNIHNRICNLVELSQYGVSHLIKFAFLVHSFMKIGYEKVAAVHTSALEVYVHSASTGMGYPITYWSDLKEILAEESKTCRDGLFPDIGLDNVVLNSENLTALTLIRLQAEPLRLLLSDSGDALDQIFSGFKNIEFTNTLKLQKTYMLMLYECSSFDDCQLRYLYLKDMLKHVTSSTNKLEKINEQLFAEIRRRKHYFAQIFNNFPWNTKLFPRIRDYTYCIVPDDEQHEVGLRTLMYLKAFLLEIPHETTVKRSEISALGFSQAVHKLTINDKVNNIFLTNLAPFLSKMRDVLIAVLEQAKLEFSSYVKIITSLFWFNQFIEVGKERLFKNKLLSTILLDKLLLHFKWLDKNLIKLLEDISPDFRRAHIEYDKLLQKMINYKQQITHPINPLKKMYTKLLTKFQPYYCEKQIDCLKMKKEFDSLLSVVPAYGAFNTNLVAKKFAIQKSDCVKKFKEFLSKERTVDLRCNCASDTPSADTFNEAEAQNESEKSIEKLTIEMDTCKYHTELEEYQSLLLEIKTSVNNSSCSENVSINQIETGIIALREFFICQFLTQLFTNNSSNAKLNYLFIENTSSLSLISLELLQMISSDKFAQYEKLFEDTLRDLEAIGTDVMRSDQYRLIATFSRVISSDIYYFLLNNLVVRSDTYRCIEDNEEEVKSTLNYSAPPLTENIISTLFHRDGDFKTVSLNDLTMWKTSLCVMRQLIWSNSQLMTNTFDLSTCNFKNSITMSSRLLLELDFIQQLPKKQKTDNFSNYNVDFEKLINKLKQHLDKSKSDMDLQNHPMLMAQKNFYNASLLNSLVGIIELCLLTFTPLIDPVEKNRLRMEYLEENISTLTTLNTAYDFMRIVMNYNHLGSSMYNEVNKGLQNLALTKSTFSHRVALRPTKCIYNNLVEDINYFLKTNCDPKVVDSLLNTVDDTWQHCTNSKSTLSDTELHALSEVYKKLDMWITNSQKLINYTLTKYTGYYDEFLKPIEYSVGLTRYGFEGLKTCLMQIKSSIIVTPNGTIQNINDNGKLYNVLLNIIEFPTVNNLQAFNPNCSRNIHKNRSNIFSIFEKIDGSEFEYFRLIKTKIRELKNYIAVTATITEDSFHELDFTLHICNQIWQSEEDRKRKQKAEDESLYVTRTRAETENEELIEQQEIEENFPTSVQEDFGEFIVEDTLEKVMKLSSSKKILKSNQVIHDDDYVFLAQNFIDIMEKFSSVYYYIPVHNTNERTPEDYLVPFKDRLRVFIKLFSNYKTALNDTLDKNTLNSFTLAIGLQQEKLNEISFDDQNTKAYNFYKDSNIPEIISCTDLLDRIETRVKVQLELYPEHAGLNDIVLVISKIRSLSSTSPVVRFNTGFQILRQKISVWNEIAHKNNHLRDLESGVAEYVQKWTKLELQYWRTCLSQTYERVQSNACKYWFFIYNLLQEYIHDREVNSSLTDIKDTEKRFVEGEIVDVDDVNTVKISEQDIIRILRQFIESANYGDFEVRLRLLKSFELYLHYIPSVPEQKKLRVIAGLHNLHIYFNQFSAEIEDTKKSIKAPIEKKLKEFVKIESYNKDLSYFSMRNNVARVHKHLNKFLKEYHNQLIQKITPVFRPKDATVKDYNFESNKGRDLRYDSKVKYCMADPKHFIAPKNLKEQFETIPDKQSGDTNLICRAGNLFVTARNVVKKIVTNASYSSLTNVLDEFLVNQTDTCEHLRSLQVDRSQTRQKQVLEAKSILQQKRKALADLFKALSNLGINYRSGLMEASLTTELEDYAIRPYCVTTMLQVSKDKKAYQNIVQLNENLDKYFAKCIFKLKLLRNAMLTPPSELGPPNIERIKGFAIEMFLLVQKQRNLLSESTCDLHGLRNLLANLRTLAEQNTVEDDEFNFAKGRDEYMILRQSMSKICIVLEQFLLLLKCPPVEIAEENTLIRNSQPIHSNQEKFQQTISHCNKLLQSVKNTLTEFGKDDIEFLSLEKVKYYRSTYAEIRQQLECIRATFATSNNEYLPVAKCLTELLSHMKSVNEVLLREDAEMEKLIDLENIEVELENIVHSILISFQTVYKKVPDQNNCDSPSKEKKSSPRKKPSTDSEIQENHLKGKIYEELRSDWNILNIHNLIGKFSNIILCIKHSNMDRIDFLPKLTSLLPLLEQYKLLADYYIFQQLGAHKVSTKMLSIMLTVFLELSTKGFCVPADLMQDEGGDSKKNDEKQSEGFGLEDGTGENDASDKIESEDQLDDAKRPEDRNNEEKTDEGDCKEEKGIEMSDDFDAKMQDVEKPEDNDDSAESEDDEDLNKEMGETEKGADKLDDQIWGSDEEQEQSGDENELEEEDEGKGNKDEADSHNQLDEKKDSKAGEEEHDKDGLDATENPSEKKDKRKEKKDIDTMNDSEYDEDQNNPYHNQLEDPPEAEEMDLGDNFNIDDEKDGEHQEDENPFDIDVMKADAPPEQENDEEVEENSKDQNQDGPDSSDSEPEPEAGTERKADEDCIEENAEEEVNNDEDSNETKTHGDITEEEQQNQEDKSDATDEQPHVDEFKESKDKSSKEDNVQSIPEPENKGSSDQVQNDESKKDDVHQDTKLDEQDTGEDKDGVGQAENETSEKGHQGIAEAKDTQADSQQPKENQNVEKQRKQGKTDEERTLGQAEKNKLKQLQTVDKLNDKNQQEDEDHDMEPDSEEFQHVKQPKNSDLVTLDTATEEQSKQTKHQEDEAKHEDDQSEEPMEVDNNLEEPEVPEQTTENAEEVNPEKLESKSKQPSSKSDKNKEQIDAIEDVEVEGEIIETHTVPRGDDTTAHCQKEILMDTSIPQDIPVSDALELRKAYHQQLVSSKGVLLQHEDYELWQTICNKMLANARELCEQLRLILEPTKCTRLKGDYRTGRRINMKKIIPYIASQFRKDKIWLRRTKPAQRDYKITIAIDDSKSMDHNNSKELTLEAISLVSQALTLLESGRLSVLSFGEVTKIILNHTEQFDGPKLVNALNFSQEKTNIADLLDFVRTINNEEGSLSSDNGIFENLLLVLSDGRNIFSEGTVRVQNAVKLARLQRIFIVYIIIDNPENKNSILDIQSVEILPRQIISIKSYLDDFPFPYYVIVRDLNQLPLVLSEAMRQWFELVNSEE